MNNPLELWENSSMLRVENKTMDSFEEHFVKSGIHYFGFAVQLGNSEAGPEIFDISEAAHAFL